MANATSTLHTILEDCDDFKLAVYTKADSGGEKCRCPLLNCSIGTSKLVITSSSFAHCLASTETGAARAQWTKDPDARRILSSSSTRYYQHLGWPLRQPRRKPCYYSSQSLVPPTELFSWHADIALPARNSAETPEARSFRSG